MKMCSKAAFLSKGRKRQAQNQQLQQQPQQQQQVTKFSSLIKEEDEELKIDTNIFTIEFYSLQNSLNKIQMGDPYKCSNCQSFLNIHSKLYSKEQYNEQIQKLQQKVSEKPDMDIEGQEEKKMEEEKVNIEVPNQENQLKVWNQDKHLNDVKDFEKVWVCEFCGNHNKLIIEQEEIPQTEDMIYLVESNQQKNAASTDDPVTLFCIDNSGSMSTTTEIANTKKLKHGLSVEEYEMLKSFLEPGELYNQYLPNQSRNTSYVSRKQCVLAAIEKSIGELKTNYPNRKVGIVTFASEVSIIGDGFELPVTITGDKLYQKDQIINSIINEKKEFLSKPVKMSAERLFQKFAKLEEGGQTALGPAIISSLQVLDTAPPGSMIILCTDGLANVGLGALEKDIITDIQRQFYDELASIAKEKKIIISLITIRGEGCKTDVLNVLVSETNGNVTRVNPDLLEEEFANILQDELVAFDITCKIRVHKAFKFRNELEENLSDNQSLFTKEMKTATKQTTIACEYQQKNDVEIQAEQINLEYLQKVPFQAQIFFTSSDGNKFVRIITQMLDVTENLEEAEKQANVEVMYKRLNQQCQQLAIGGYKAEAQAYNRHWVDYLNTNSNINSNEDNMQYNFAQEKVQKEFRKATHGQHKKMAFQPQVQQQKKKSGGFFSNMSKKIKEKFSKKSAPKSSIDGALFGSSLKKKPEQIQEQEEDLCLSDHSSYSSDEENVIIQKQFK